MNAIIGLQNALHVHLQLYHLTTFKIPETHRSLNILNFHPFAGFITTKIYIWKKDGLYQL